MKKNKTITISTSEEIELTERERQIYKAGEENGLYIAFITTAVILIIVCIIYEIAK